MSKVIFSFDINDDLYFNDNFYYTVIGRKIDMNGTHQIKKYLLKCSICGFESWKTEKYIKRCMKHDSPNYTRYSCNNCGGRVSAKKHTTPVGVTDPRIIKLFCNEDDAFSVSRGSGQYRYFKCPTCGDKKHLSIKQVVRDGKINCQFCDDGYSYPNKFGYAFLKQLNIDNLVCEYTDEWTNGKRYDFSFFYCQKHYLVEMDGELHFVSGFGNDVEIIKNNDRIKDNLAKENNCELIRIDCKKSEFDYIKTNIINSVFSEIFDLDLINWDKIQKECFKNKILEVCKYYKKNSELSASEIARKFNISATTVLVYLKKGNELGIIDFKTKTERDKETRINIVNLFNKCMSIKEISNELNVKDYTVRSHLKKAGVK